MVDLFPHLVEGNEKERFEILHSFRTRISLPKRNNSCLTKMNPWLIFQFSLLLFFHFYTPQTYQESLKGRKMDFFSLYKNIWMRTKQSHWKVVFPNIFWICGHFQGFLLWNYQSTIFLASFFLNASSSPLPT